MRDVILYDGACGLCSRLVRFVLARDAAKRFVFAALQSARGQALLAQHGIAASAANQFDTLVVVIDYAHASARALVRSDAALYIARHLRGPWRLTLVLRIVPRRFRDAVYNLVARHRLRWFGPTDVCQLPSAANAHRFLDG